MVQYFFILKIINNFICFLCTCWTVCWAFIIVLFFCVIIKLVVVRWFRRKFRFSDCIYYVYCAILKGVIYLSEFFKSLVRYITLYRGVVFLYLIISIHLYGILIILLSCFAILYYIVRVVAPFILIISYRCIEDVLKFSVNGIIVNIVWFIIKNMLCHLCVFIIIGMELCGIDIWPYRYEPLKWILKVNNIFWFVLLHPVDTVCLVVIYSLNGLVWYTFFFCYLCFFFVFAFILRILPILIYAMYQYVVWVLVRVFFYFIYFCIRSIVFIWGSMKHLLTWYLIFCLWPVDASLIEMFLLTPASMVYIYIDWLLLLFIAPILYIPLFLVDLSSDTIEGIYYFFYGIEAFFLTWVNFWVHGYKMIEFIDWFYLPERVGSIVPTDIGFYGHIYVERSLAQYIPDLKYNVAIFVFDVWNQLISLLPDRIGFLEVYYYAIKLVVFEFKSGFQAVSDVVSGNGVFTKIDDIPLVHITDELIIWPMQMFYNIFLYVIGDFYKFLNLDSNKYIQFLVVHCQFMVPYLISIKLEFISFVKIILVQVLILLKTTSEALVEKSMAWVLLDWVVYFFLILYHFFSSCFRNFVLILIQWTFGWVLEPEAFVQLLSFWQRTEGAIPFVLKFVLSIYSWFFHLGIRTSLGGTLGYYFVGFAVGYRGVGLGMLLLLIWFYIFIYCDPWWKQSREGWWADLPSPPPDEFFIKALEYNFTNFDDIRYTGEEVPERVGIRDRDFRSEQTWYEHWNIDMGAMTWYIGNEDDPSSDMERSNYKKIRGEWYRDLFLARHLKVPPRKVSGRRNPLYVKYRFKTSVVWDSVHTDFVSLFFVLPAIFFCVTTWEDLFNDKVLDWSYERLFAMYCTDNFFAIFERKWHSMAWFFDFWFRDGDVNMPPELWGYTPQHLNQQEYYWSWLNYSGGKYNPVFFNQRFLRNAEWVKSNWRGGGSHSPWDRWGQFTGNARMSGDGFWSWSNKLWHAADNFYVQVRLIQSEDNMHFDNNNEFKQSNFLWGQDIFRHLWHYSLKYKWNMFKQASFTEYRRKYTVLPSNRLMLRSDDIIGRKVALVEEVSPGINDLFNNIVKIDKRIFRRKIKWLKTYMWWNNPHNRVPGLLNLVAVSERVYGRFVDYMNVLKSVWWYPMSYRKTRSTVYYLIDPFVADYWLGPKIYRLDVFLYSQLIEVPLYIDKRVYEHNFLLMDGGFNIVPDDYSYEQRMTKNRLVLNLVPKSREWAHLGVRGDVFGVPRDYYAVRDIPWRYHKTSNFWDVQCSKEYVLPKNWNEYESVDQECADNRYIAIHRDPWSYKKIVSTNIEVATDILHRKPGIPKYWGTLHVGIISAIYYSLLPLVITVKVLRDFDGYSLWYKQMFFDILDRAVLDRIKASTPMNYEYEKDFRKWAKSLKAEDVYDNIYKVAANTINSVDLNNVQKYVNLFFIDVLKGAWEVYLGKNFGYNYTFVVDKEKMPDNTSLRDMLYNVLWHKRNRYYYWWWRLLGIGKVKLKAEWHFKGEGIGSMLYQYKTMTWRRQLSPFRLPARQIWLYPDWGRYYIGNFYSYSDKCRERAYVRADEFVYISPFTPGYPRIDRSLYHPNYIYSFFRKRMGIKKLLKYYETGLINYTGKKKKVYLPADWTMFGTNLLVKNRAYKLEAQEMRRSGETSFQMKARAIFKI